MAFDAFDENDRAVTGRALAAAAKRIGLDRYGIAAEQAGHFAGVGKKDGGNPGLAGVGVILRQSVKQRRVQRQGFAERDEFARQFFRGGIPGHSGTGDDCVRLAGLLDHRADRAPCKAAVARRSEADDHRFRHGDSKWDGDVGRPNLYAPLSEESLARKIDLLHRHFGTQRSKAWFDEETFRGLARLRGVECRERYAEAFFARKLMLRQVTP